MDGGVRVFLAVFFFVGPLFGQGGAAPVTVPLVGCASIGQTGYVGAPPGGTATVQIPAAAKALALYKSHHGLTVLAPRGWHCLGGFGSGGDSLTVRPQAFRYRDDISGPGVEVVRRHASGSGRFDVAAILWRIFPAMARAKYSGAAPDDGLTGLPQGPFPSDRMEYRDSHTAFYETAAGQKGLGTEYGVPMSDGPILGVVRMDEKEDQMYHVAVQLPGSLRHLAPVIQLSIATSILPGHN